MRARLAAVTLKSNQEIQLMRVAASTTAEIVDEVARAVRPGVTTWELDQIAEDACRRRNVTPAFKGLYGFPASLCVAVNDVVVHGIPSREVILREGDLIGLDFGVVYRGWYGDHARTLAVGHVDSEAIRLIDVTIDALAAGLDQCRPGNRLRDIGKAIEERARMGGYSVVRDFVGHGIGRRLHEEPGVFNYFDRQHLMRLQAGMVLCVEPMVNAGAAQVNVLDYQWTAVTADGSRSAHFEHTIAITSSGPEVLSVPGWGAGAA